MEFTNSFTVQAPLDLVWNFLLDAEAVSPCVPGATLTESIDATHHKGTVKVKLGAVQMSYRGELEMIPDEEARTIVLKAKGTEQRGSGGASGTFTNVLREEAGATTVEIHTRVDITGKVAQFGRGIMQDVANRMIKEFSNCLERKIQERIDARSGTGEVSAEPAAPAPGAPPAGAGDQMPPAATTAVETPAPAAATGAPATSATGPQEANSAGAQTAPPPPAPPRTSPPAAPSPSTSANELSMTKLIADITRQKVADGLRTLARRIDPD